MSFWLEVRCPGEVHSPAVWNDSAGRYDECENRREIGTLTGDLTGDLLEGKRYIERTLRARGWKRTRAHGWLCPWCQKHRFP